MLNNYLNNMLLVNDYIVTMYGADGSKGTFKGNAYPGNIKVRWDVDRNVWPYEIRNQSWHAFIVPPPGLPSYGSNFGPSSRSCNDDKAKPTNVAYITLSELQPGIGAGPLSGGLWAFLPDPEPGSEWVLRAKYPRTGTYPNYGYIKIVPEDGIYEDDSYCPNAELSYE